MNTLPFQVSIALSPEETEIRAWLKHNRAVLEDRSAGEVAELAVRCGFNIADVCATLSTFQDAMQGSHCDNRAAFQGWLLDRAILDAHDMRKKLEDSKKATLLPQWVRLVDYTITGKSTEEFNENK